MGNRLALAVDHATLLGTLAAITALWEATRGS